MNSLGTEVTETTADRRYGDARPSPRDALSGSTIQTMEQLLGTIGGEPRPEPSGRKGRSSSGLAPWQALRVRDYVESMLSGDIDVACLAKIAKLSASHFARAFRASFGATPAVYVAIRRVERAKSMMLETAEPLCRISLDCGFTDQSHLSRAFRRQVGLSPSQWRRRHRVA